MAKKPLREPLLPPGKRRDFFELLRALVVRSGDQSVAHLADGMGCSHQTVYKGLTGPRMPSRAVAGYFAKYFGELGDPRVNSAIMRAWADGVLEERAELAGAAGRLGLHGGNNGDESHEDVHLPKEQVADVRSRQEQGESRQISSENVWSRQEPGEKVSRQREPPSALAGETAIDLQPTVGTTSRPRRVEAAQELAAELRKLYRRRGSPKLEYFADRVPASPASVSRWLSGQAVPDKWALSALLDSLSPSDSEVKELMELREVAGPDRSEALHSAAYRSALDQLASAMRELRDAHGRPSLRRIEHQIRLVSRSTLSSWLGGRTLPSHEGLVAFVEVFEGDLEKFDALWLKALVARDG